MLFLNDQFFEIKPCFFKDTHNIKRHRYHMTLLAGVTHKDSTEFVFFQNTIAFGSYGFHFLKEAFDFQMRQIFLYIFAVLNNVSIRRMCANKVDAIIMNKIQMTCITFAYINIAISTIVFKINFFSTTRKGNIINIDAYDITVEQFCFNKCIAVEYRIFIDFS